MPKAVEVAKHSSPISQRGKMKPAVSTATQRKIITTTAAAKAKTSSLISATARASRGAGNSSERLTPSPLHPNNNGATTNAKSTPDETKSVGSTDEVPSRTVIEKALTALVQKDSPWSTATAFHLAKNREGGNCTDAAAPNNPALLPLQQLHQDDALRWTDADEAWFQREKASRAVYQHIRTLLRRTLHEVGRPLTHPELTTEPFATTPTRSCLRRNPPLSHVTHDDSRTRLPSTYWMQGLHDDAILTDDGFLSHCVVGRHNASFLRAAEGPPTSHQVINDRRAVERMRTAPPSLKLKENGL